MEIGEGLLDRTGAALLSRNFDAFFVNFAVPHTIETFDGTTTITNRNDMEQRFYQVCDFMRSKRVTDLVRHIMEAMWVDENTIRYSHQSRLLSGLTLVQAPYPNLSDAQLIDGEWKVIRSQYAIVDAPDHNYALTGDGNTTQTGEIK